MTGFSSLSEFPISAILGQQPPTVVLNSPADASSDPDTTPTLNFTGTDANGDSIEYEVQIDTETFNSVTATNLTSGSNISGSTTSFVTSSITPGANKLIILNVVIRNGASTNPANPTSVTGCGLTWELIDSHIIDSTSTSRRRQCMYRAMGSSPSTGAVTINLAETDTGGVWIIDEFSNIDTSGTNGSGAIVQSAKNSDETFAVSSLTVTLSAFSSVNNATYGFFSNTDGNQTTTAGSGFSKVGDSTQTDANASHRFTSEFRNDNDTSVDITYSAVEAIAGIAIEIKARTPLIDSLSSSDAGFSGTAGGNNIVSSNLTSGLEKHAGKTSWLTASISPAANNLILLTVSIYNNAATNPGDPSVSGCGLTWVLENSQLYDSSSGSRRKMFLFRALGSSTTTGQITITTAETDIELYHSVDQYSNVDTSGTNGSGAIVQTATNVDESATSATITATLGAFSNTLNATHGSFATNGQTLSSVGSGFTKLGDTGGVADGISVVTEYKSTNDTSVNMTWAANCVMGVIAAEIKAGHPFSSGSAVDYTVQSALTTSITYYWRVRATDPIGSNTWGSWSSTRSFTVGSGGGPVSSGNDWPLFQIRGFRNWRFS